MFLLFIQITVAQFFAEMGDKTQLMLVAMTEKHKMADIILGTAIAILVLNGIAVLAGGAIGQFIPSWIIKFIAAAAFLFFAATTIKDDDDEDEEGGNSKINFAPLAVFCTFFIAELGDKTQLTAITFGANEGLSNAIIVWLACSIGLFAADILGLVIIHLLKGHIPQNFIKLLSFLIFTVSGILTLNQAASMIFSDNTLIWTITIGSSVIFATLCIILFVLQQKKRKSNS